MTLEFKDLCKYFKDKRAVDQLNVTIHEGVNGLLGANGAGKTTIIVALLAFYSGSVIPQGSFLERVVFLFPASALNHGYFIGRPIVYNIFGKPVLFVYLYIPACIIMSIILALLIVRKFEAMEL